MKRLFRQTHYSLASAIVIAGLLFGLFVDVNITLTPSNARALPHSDRILPVMPTFYSSQEIAGFYPAVTIRNIDFSRTRQQNYVETGDLDAISRHMTLRILDVERSQDSKHGDNTDRALVNRFAEELGLTPLWINTSNRQQSIEYLQQGLGDLIIDHATLYLPESADLGHSVPLRRDRFDLITRRDSSDINSLADMQGRRIGLRMGSPLWPQLEQQQQEHGFELIAMPDYLPDSQLVDAMREDRFDALILHQQRLQSVIPQYLDIVTAFTLNMGQPVSWLMRPDADRLQASLDEFLQTRQSELRAEELYWGDLDNIRKRGVLRIITRPLDGGYSLRKGQPGGFEFELIRHFAEQQSLRYQVVMADDDEGMLRLLRQGLGDVIIAPLDARIELSGQVRPTRPYTEQPEQRWFVRGNNTELGGALDSFIETSYRSEFYNLARRRDDRQPLDRTLQFSPYDDIVREYADRYHFDWLLIIAQMYQESQFNPLAESSAGAIGLMQMLPSTATELGVADLHEPEASIHSGVRYMHQLRERFEGEITVQDRTWFALAAYNAGFSRVEKARRVAKELGYDPNRWFGHVEKAMRAMTREGNGTPFCRCGQTLAYVRNIRQLFTSYVEISKGFRLAGNDTGDSNQQG